VTLPTALPAGAASGKIDEPAFALAYAGPAVRKLARELGVVVEMFDERLTSFEARERLAGTAARNGARKTGIDALAAVVILEGWMQAHAEKIPRAGRWPGGQ